MIPYYDMSVKTNSPIAVSVFSTMLPVEAHRHAFHEFVLITKGFCIHRYKDISMPLIPGDVFLIPPHQQHEYIIETPVSMYNCQFFPENIGKKWDEEFGGILKELAFPPPQSSVYRADLNKQNIIHLSMTEANHLQAMLDRIHQEEQERSYGYEQINLAYLNLMLINIARAKLNQGMTKTLGTPRNTMVRKAQKYVNEHMLNPLSFSDYAKSQNVSAGYFRTLFKSETGLTPVDYLNRVRIVTAIEYLKDIELPIAEVAARVGVLDANYFSRLFRRFIGYSPTEFRRRTIELSP